MTTICWDGLTLASDGRATLESHIISDNFQKIFKLDSVPYKNDTLIAIAMAGGLTDFELVLDHINDIEYPFNSISHEVMAIVIGEKYCYHLEQDASYLIRYPRDSKLADGSGGAFARSALVMGMSSPAAVKHAMKLDSASGGKVQKLVLPITSSVK